MSKNRIKKSLQPAITTREEAEVRMNELATAANTRISLIADLDDKILAMKSQFESAIAKQDEVIKAASADLEAWAVAHPELFVKPKSVAFLSGVVGFRTGTPRLKLLRGWNWGKVTEAVQQLLPNFIRSKPEVDKEGIIATRDDLAEFLPDVGLEVVQNEGFYIEPKLTNPEAL